MASITSPIACRRILEHLKLDSDYAVATPARAPPEEIGGEYSFELEDFDQSQSW